MEIFFINVGERTQLKEKSVAVRRAVLKAFRPFIIKRVVMLKTENGEKIEGHY